MMPKKSKYSILSNVFYMIHYTWKKHEKKVLFGTFLIILGRVAIHLLELYISPVVIQMLETQVSFLQFSETLLLFLLGLFVAKGLVSYMIQVIKYSKITIRMELVADINQKEMTTSYPNVLDKHFWNLGNETRRAVNSNSSATEFIWTVLADLFVQAICFFVFLYLLSTFNLWILIMIVVFSLVSYFLNLSVSRFEYQHRDEEGEMLKKISYQTRLGENRSLAKEIRVFGIQNWLDEITTQVFSIHEGFRRKLQKRYLFSRIVNLLLIFLRNAISYVFLINSFMNHNISLAEFLLYLSTINTFASWVTGLLDQLYSLSQISNDISIVREFLEYPEPFLLDSAEAFPHSQNGLYEIRFEHVYYRYPNAKDYALKDINLCISPGEKLAIVGLNGAGKSTLILILCGLLSPTKGKVLLNGNDISQFNRTDYYSLFAAVFQKNMVLPGTIAMNVAQSHDIDYKRVEECIQKADLTKKIKSLPKGLQSKLNRTIYHDAIDLSGGEFQRLFLARALYKPASILVLDEPTAALDPIAESELYQEYNHLTQNYTSIFISHRLASTQFCDRILFIKDGSIQEEGTHDELLKKNGSYRKLYDIQSKYYQGGDEDA